MDSSISSQNLSTHNQNPHETDDGPSVSDLIGADLVRSLMDFYNNDDVEGFNSDSKKLTKNPQKKYTCCMSIRKTVIKDSYPMNNPQNLLKSLESALERGQDPMRDILFTNLRGNIFYLMINEDMQYVFQTFVDACHGKELKLLVREIFWKPDWFIHAAFSEQGAISIIKLIHKLKNTIYSFDVAAILATKFFELMTHQTARNVILQCFNVFGTGPNKILYDQAIRHSQRLAVDLFGYKSLSACIDVIPGIYRSWLLDDIAHFSYTLANNPYGNFIVQHALRLRYYELTRRIFSRLHGKIIELAMEKNGSHVVETCMESSSIGLHFVVREILSTPEGPIQLALNPFGNNVIQKAFKIAKKKGYDDLYSEMWQSLEPYIGGA